MTLVEILVAVGISSIVLGAIMMLFMFSNRSFVAMGNYVSLDRDSRNGIDQMSKEIRQATALVAFQTNMPKSLTFTIPNDTGSYTVSYQWVSDSSGSAILRIQNGVSTVLLTNVDLWNFKICQRTPMTNMPNEFYLATNTAGVLDPKECKLIDMTWKCFREILKGKKANTEVVQTAQIVLRNKGMTQATNN